MTTGVPIVHFRPQFFDDDGNPLSAGSVTTYLAGTTTPATLYSDAALTVPLMNPLDLNLRGEPQTTLFAAADVLLDVVLKDSAGQEIYTLTDYRFSHDIVYERTAVEIAATYTPASLAYQPGDIRRYGATLDGVANCATAIASAGTFAGFVLIEGGVAKLSTNLTLTVPVSFGPSGFLDISASTTLAMAGADLIAFGEGRIRGTGTVVTGRGQVFSVAGLARGLSSLALGESANTAGDDGIGIGRGTLVDGRFGIALGQGAVENSAYGTAIGYNSIAGAAAATTATTAGFGQGATALNVVSIVGFTNGSLVRVKMTSGRWHYTTINGAPAAGVITLLVGLEQACSSGATVQQMTGEYELSIGTQAITIGTGAVAVGRAAYALSAGAVALGTNASATGTNSIAVGASTIANAATCICFAPNVSFAIANAQLFGKPGNKLLFGLSDQAGIGAVADGDMPNNSVAFYYDLSGGTKYLRVKVKDNTATVRTGTVTIA